MALKKHWNPIIKGICFILKIEKSYIHIDALNIFKITVKHNIVIWPPTKFYVLLKQ